MIFTWLFTMAMALDCPEPVSTTAITEGLSAAQQMFIDFDEEGFRDKVNEVSGILLPCVDEKLSPEASGQLHRMMGLHLLSIGDEDNAQASMRAAKRVDPEFEFTDDLLPADHDLRNFYESLELSDNSRKVPEPKTGSLAFDGEQTRMRPKAAPTVAQLFDERGVPSITTYLGVREALPSYAAIPRKRNALITCAAGAGAMSLGTYGLAFSRKQKMLKDAPDQSLPREHYDGLRTQANTFTLTSGMFAMIAGGCGLGAGMIGQR